MWKLVPLLVALYLVLGCGGSSTSSGTRGTPSALTRGAVREGYARSLMGLAQAGMFAGGGNSGGTTGSSGYGFPMIGPFVYRFLPSGGDGGGTGGASPMASLRRSLSHRGVDSGGTNGGGTDGSGTNGGGSSFYYDEYLGLWVDVVSTDTSFTQYLYTDESKFQSAGVFESTFPSGWDTYPYQYESTFYITAGNQKGAHGRYSTVVEGDEKGKSEFETVWPNLGSDSGESTWNRGASTWAYSSHLDDAWWSGSGESLANGSGKSTFSDSFGFRASYVYRADGSGSGRIEGPQEGLPAKITWTSDWRVRIVYADGTAEEWNPYDYFGGGDGGTNTTGTVGSG